MNVEIDGLVKILSDKEIDWLLGCYMVVLVVGEMINEVVFVMEYGVFSEDIVCVCYVYLVWVLFFK